MKIDMEMLSFDGMLGLRTLAPLANTLIVTEIFFSLYINHNIYFLWAIYIYASVTIIDLIVIVQQLYTLQIPVRC